MRIFVGNLLFTSTKEDVQKLFQGFGTVDSVSIRNKSGKNPRGFGFVEMSDENQALSAIAALEGKDFMGRILNVTPERVIVEKSEPIIIVPEQEIKEIPEVKEKKFPSKHRKAGSWEKRKGKGKSKNWKKKPGGVKKKFKD